MLQKTDYNIADKSKSKLAVPDDDDEFILIIMRGLPGSGKSTYVKKNYGQDVVICSADDFHMVNGKYCWKPENVAKAHTSCREKFLLAVDQKKRRIAIDNTNTTLREMDLYFRIAKESGYKVKFIRLVVTPEISYQRNVHKVPLDSIKKMYNRFQDVPERWGTEEIVNTSS